MIKQIQSSALKALGRIERVMEDIRMVQSLMTALPLWTPGVALRKEAEEVSSMMSDLEERFEKKLVITILGPSGSGKSTLLNALAGIDNLSPSGNTRPTTRNLVALCREMGDADQLLEQLGPNSVQIKTSMAAASLEHVLLVDTPDTDSTLQEEHIPLLHNVIALSDILLCVFDGENPKRRDHVDFLAPFVRKFDGESLLAVINKCDRLGEEELKGKIIPEFSRYIGRAWERPVDKVLCVSARGHLEDPAWDEKTYPKHEFDQFETLHGLVFGTFNRPGFVVDRRLENASRLKAYIFEEIAGEIVMDKEAIAEAATRIRKAEKRAIEKALSSIKDNDTGKQPGVNVLLYGKLAQRWIGPVGWLIALWARIIILSTGISAIIKQGHPLRQISGMTASLKHLKAATAESRESMPELGADAAMREYRLTILREWPEIAKLMIKGRFDRSIRKSRGTITEEGALGGELLALWQDALNTEVEKASRALSGPLFQLILNLPVLGILCHAGWITAREYFARAYLPSDFFVHAFMTVGIVLFLSFFTFQGFVRLFAGRDRIKGRAFLKLKQQVDDFRTVSKTTLGEQIEVFFDLASLVESHKKPD